MKTIVRTDGAPAPIGPYSQAVKCGQFVFLSGQLPVDPQSGAVVDGGIREQTAQVLENLRAVLQAAGSSPAHVLKTTVFLQDMATFPEMNAVYADFFGEEKAPARATVEVSALPKGVLVEIELVAECA